MSGNWEILATRRSLRATNGGKGSRQNETNEQDAATLSHMCDQPLIETPPTEERPCGNDPARGAQSARVVESPSWEAEEVKTAGATLIAAVRLFSSGCTRPDWIDATLVTVDVTGVWQGTAQEGRLD
jgi:hypothetical protein